MRPFWPQTLKTRIILILCSFFVLSHITSLVIYEHNRNKTILLTEAADLAARIVGVVKLAGNFPNENRQQILKAAETQFLAMFPETDFSDEMECQSNAFSQRMFQSLTEAFTDDPTVDFDICLREFNSIPLPGKAGSAHGLDVLISFSFTHSEPATFHAVLPEGESLLQDAVILYLLLSGASTLLIAWYLIRKTVTPLEHLAQAADQIGVDIHSPKLDESGPSEITLAATAFNRMQSRLQQLVHGQTEMLAAISHDLRSAITRLQLRVELLNDDNGREGMLRVTKDMKAMVQSVMDFVRGIDSNESTKNINITALIESLCDDLRQEGYPVNFANEETQHVIPGRSLALRRGFQNLIDNAIKYGQEAHISIHSDENSLSIEIEDRGPGIPVEELEKVSTPFYRLDKSRNSATGGVGLGLSIAENIFNAHGASLTLRNNEKGGLVATVVFSNGRRPQ